MQQTLSIWQHSSQGAVAQKYFGKSPLRLDIAYYLSDTGCKI